VFAEANLVEAKSRDELEERIARVRQQLAGARRALDRYFPALTIPTGERIGMLNGCMEALSSPPRSNVQLLTL
jgi:hypothetical protein